VKLRVAGRLIEIQRVLVRHRLDDFVRATHLYRPLRFLFYLSPWTWFQRRRGATRAERLRFALEELGPIFVKFGQALSTRRDLLPSDIADELAKLQDKVPPFPGSEARASLERSYGQPLPALFSEFAIEPLAAVLLSRYSPLICTVQAPDVNVVMNPREAGSLLPSMCIELTTIPGV